MKHFSFLSLLLALALLVASPILAQPLAATSAISFNPNGLSAEVTGRAVAVDAAGNQMLAGFFVGKMQFGSIVLTSTDTAAFVARRSGSTGDWLWAASVGGTGRSVALGVAVDATGNAVLTGRFANTVRFTTSAAGALPVTTTALTAGGNTDGFVASFAANTGACRWAVAVGGPGRDVSNRVAVDAAGDAYLVGTFSGSAAFVTSAPGTQPAVSTTLSSTGAVGVFVARFIGATGACAWAVLGGGSTGAAVAADGSGHVYVTGAFSGSTAFITSVPGASPVTTTPLTSVGGLDVYLARLDASTGACQWALRGGSSSYDVSTALACDAAGNVGLAGRSTGSPQFSAAPAGVSPSTTLTPTTINGTLFVARFAPSGACLWVVQPGSGSGEAANGLALDAAGNTYLTGNFNTLANFTSSAPGVTPVTQITLYSGASQEVFIARFAAATGACQWAQHADGGPTNETGYDVAVSATGVPYFTGRFWRLLAFGADYAAASPGEGTFIESLDPFSGAWQAPSQPLSGCQATATTITTDAAGDQYVGGYFEGRLQLGSTVLTAQGIGDLLLAKRSGRTGAWLWAVKGGGTGGEFVNSVAVDGSGGVYVAGIVYNDTYTNVIRFATSAPGVVPATYTIAALPYTTTGRPSTRPDILVARFDAATGACTWATAAGGIESDGAAAIVADGAGHLLLTGTTNVQASFFTSAAGASPATTITLAGRGSADGFLARLQAATGACDWAVSMGDYDNDSARRLAADASGRVAVVGTFANRATFVTSAPGVSPVTTRTLTATSNTDGFVATFDGNTGACRWATQLGGQGTDAATKVALSSTGEVFAAGQFVSAAAFFTSVPGTLPVTRIVLTAAGSNDIFLGRFDASTGACIAVVPVSSTSYDTCTGLTFDAAGSLFLSGDYASALSFITSAPGTSPPTLLTLPATPLANTFLARFAPATLACTGAVAAGGPNAVTSLDLAVNADGVAYIAGSFTNQATFGPTLLAGAGTTSYIAEFSGAAITATAAPAARALPLLAYPNPAHGTVRAVVPGGGASGFVLLDNMGRLVRSWPLRRAEAGTEVLLPLGSVSPGIYTLRYGPAATRLAVE